MNEVAAALLRDLDRPANSSLPPPTILTSSTPSACSFSSLAREIVCGTTPTMLKPNSFAPTAAPSAVFPIDGTTSSRVFPLRLRCSSRCRVPRILKEPDGARNSHLAYTSQPGKRFPRRTSGVGGSGAWGTSPRKDRPSCYSGRGTGARCREAASGFAVVDLAPRSDNITVSYSLTTIWYERQRFLPAILAVAFSAVLVAVQAGLVIGLLSMMSVPVDKAAADVWVGYPGVRSVDLGRPIPERWVVRLAAHPEVERAESVIIGFSLWTRPGASPGTTISEVCTVVGSRLDPDSLGAVEAVRGDRNLLTQLTVFGAVAVDESELGRLGIRGAGDDADVLGYRVRVVGTVKGYKSLGGPYVFCSIDTARALMRYQSDEVTYLVAKTSNSDDAWKVARRMSGYPQLTALTADEFSVRSRMHWLLTTKAGIAMGFTAMLGLLVGAVVTSQTLYAATAASQREFATLRAMGIPRWRLKLNVLAQSFWVGLLGIIVAVPVTLLLAEGANSMGISVRLHPIILAAAAGVTMSMAIGAGLAALRSFQMVDPAHNIR